MSDRARPSGSGERGFTLIELLVVLAITGSLLALSGLTIRRYWQNQALDGGADEIVSQLRRQQERSVSESVPLVYGARFREGSSAWGLVQFDPTPTPDTCIEVGARTFSNGVIVSTAPAKTTFATGTANGVDLTALCRGQSGWTTDEFVFFYPRGTATQGLVTIFHPSLGREQQISVAGLTGRVVRS